MMWNTLLKKLLLGTSLLVLFLVMLGAFVRLSDAGLGCPDWPGCYGHVGVPSSEEHIRHAEATYGGVVEAHKAWKEMLHRYLATIVGLLIIMVWVLSVLVKKATQPIAPLSTWMKVGLPTLLVFTVIFQGLLGMWTVTLLLKPAIVSAHLLGGLLTLSILVWLTLYHYQTAHLVLPLALKKLRIWAGLALLLVVMQISLGGWVSTNYAALACLDFPSCQGHLVPKDMEFNHAFHLVRELNQTAEGAPLSQASKTAIHWLHRVGALLVFLLVHIYAIKLIKTGGALRRLGWIILGVLLLQISLGIANVQMKLPLAIAVLHNGGAALLLISVLSSGFYLWRARFSVLSVVKGRTA